jgi:hypothetical protein
MRLARLVPLALATLPAVAMSQASESQPVASQPRAGQYRTALELIEFDVPGDAAGQAREAFVEELASGNDFCLGRGADEPLDRQLLEQIAEGECSFGTFDRTGAAVKAVMLCTRDTTVGSQVTMNGQVWTENADLDMILEQEFGANLTRIRVRARPARVGDC